MKKEDAQKQIEKLNGKIRIQLEEFDFILQKLTEYKNNPEMIVFHNVSRRLLQVEFELNALIAEKSAYQNIIG